MRLIHDDTKISFGGSIGPSDFIEWWHPEDPNSKLWKELETILRVGGGFSSDGAFVAPYVSAAQWPEKFDEFEYSTITAKNVPCYPTPDLTSKPIRTLSFDFVRTLINDSNFAEFKRLQPLGWRQIELLDGKVGYVRSKYVRSGVDQRIYFSKGSDGKWSNCFSNRSAEKTTKIRVSISKVDTGTQPAKGTPWLNRRLRSKSRSERPRSGRKLRRLSSPLLPECRMTPLSRGQPFQPPTPRHLGTKAN